IMSGASTQRYLTPLAILTMLIGEDEVVGLRFALHKTNDLNEQTDITGIIQTHIYKFEDEFREPSEIKPEVEALQRAFKEAAKQESRSKSMTNTKNDVKENIEGERQMTRMKTMLYKEVVHGSILALLKQEMPQSLYKFFAITGTGTKIHIYTCYKGMKTACYKIVLEGCLKMGTMTVLSLIEEAITYYLCIIENIYAQIPKL
ncbi:hypothetical protein ACJX0J_022187, partial [Zea mays]